MKSKNYIWGKTMIRQLEELNEMVQAWIDRQDADGCGGCAFQDVKEWNMPCLHCKRIAKDYWRKKEKKDES